MQLKHTHVAGESVEPPGASSARWVRLVHGSALPRPGRVRSPASAAALVLCTILFGFVGVLVQVGDVSAFEEDVFRVANDLPAWLAPVLKTLMQLGWYPAIFAVATVLLLMRRFALARDVVLAGSLAYGTMLVTKLAFARQRPTVLLDSVISRGTFDETKFGFPSGHVAVATAIVAVLAVYVPHRVRRWWWALVPVVMWPGCTSERTCLSTSSAAHSSAWRPRR
jgi:membrane-associated phospholipid phosphatase